MLTCTDRLTRHHCEAVGSAHQSQSRLTPVLLRTHQRSWFGSSERAFNPLVCRATLLRSFGRCN